MKKIFIDKLLKKYVVPSEVRNLSVSSSGIIYTPGTRIPFPEDVKFIRLYTAWGHTHKGKGEVHYDIDLSSSFVTKDEEVIDVAYYSQSSNMAQLSGDEVTAGEWNTKSVFAEFIDIDVKLAVENNVSYAVTSQFIYGSRDLTEDYDTDVNVYSGVKFLAERTSISKKIDISDSFLRLKLAGKFQTHTPLAIDFENREIVIIDHYNEASNNINAFLNRSNMQNVKKSYFNALDYKTNMYKFMKMYSKANDLKIVKSIEEADIVVSYNNIGDKDTQEIFNVSDNLEKIISLLS